MIAGLNAGDLVRVASETLGGRGGGKDDIAQGGGTDGARAEDALKSVEYAIGRTLQSSRSRGGLNPSARSSADRPAKTWSLGWAASVAAARMVSGILGFRRPATRARRLRSEVARPGTSSAVSMDLPRLGSRDRAVYAGGRLDSAAPVGNATCTCVPDARTDLRRPMCESRTGVRQSTVHGTAARLAFLTATRRRQIANLRTSWPWHVRSCRPPPAARLQSAPTRDWTAERPVPPVAGESGLACGWHGLGCADRGGGV